MEDVERDQGDSTTEQQDNSSVSAAVPEPNPGLSEYEKEKPFKCYYCDRRYKVEYARDRHVRKVHEPLPKVEETSKAETVKTEKPLEEWESIEAKDIDESIPMIMQLPHEEAKKDSEPGLYSYIGFMGLYAISMKIAETTKKLRGLPKRLMDAQQRYMKEIHAVLIEWEIITTSDTELTPTTELVMHLGLDTFAEFQSNQDETPAPPPPSPKEIESNDEQKEMSFDEMLKHHNIVR